MFKVIINPSIARQLLQMGNQIIDIKPNKDKKTETVFLFKDDDKFKQDIDIILKK